MTVTLEVKRAWLAEMEKKQIELGSKIELEKQEQGLSIPIIDDKIPNLSTGVLNSYDPRQVGGVYVRTGGFISIQLHGNSNGSLGIQDHIGKQLVTILAGLYGMKVSE